MINETIQITQEQFMKVHWTKIVPILVVLYLINIFSFLIVGLNVVKQSRHKFFLIWMYSSIISALFLAILIIFPNSTQTILAYFGGLVK